MNSIDSINKNNRSIIDFLPHSPESSIKNLQAKAELIKIIIHFINLSLESIELFFIKSEYTAFDSQVSENLCQIRAYYHLIMADKKSKINNSSELLFIKNQLIYCKANAISWLSQLMLNKERFEKTVLSVFVNDLKINCPLPLWLYLLTTNFFLCKYNLKNNEGVSLAINYYNLCYDLNASKTLARRIIHKLQKEISENSTQFILSLLSEINGYENKYNFLRQLVYRDDDGRMVLPSYPVMDIILRHSHFTQLPIMVVINRYLNEIYHDSIALMYISKNDNFVVVQNFGKFYAQPCMVMLGKTSYFSSIETKDSFINRFNAFGFQNIILANMAIHPQYPGKKLKELKHNPLLKYCHDNDMNDQCRPAVTNFLSEFKKYTIQASAMGCCMNNAKIFYLTHVYCSSVKNILKQHMTPLKSKEFYTEEYMAV